MQITTTTAARDDDDDDLLCARSRCSLQQQKTLHPSETENCFQQHNFRLCPSFGLARQIRVTISLTHSLVHTVVNCSNLSSHTHTHTHFIEHHIYKFSGQLSFNLISTLFSLVFGQLSDLVCVFRFQSISLLIIKTRTHPYTKGKQKLLSSTPKKLCIKTSTPYRRMRYEGEKDNTHTHTVVRNSNSAPDHN